MKHFKTLLVVACLMQFTLICSGQDKAKVGPDETEVQMANEYNRIQMFFNIARNKMVGVNDVEATADQIESFKALEKKREEVQRLISGTVKIKELDKRLAAFDSVILKMAELETTLVSEILLPHQVTVLKQREFENLLGKYGGDFEKVIEDYYGEKFGMTEKQKAAFQKIRKKQVEEKQRAGIEYSQKLRDIDLATKAKLGNIFNLKQVAMIKELSGLDLKATVDTSKKKK